MAEPITCSKVTLGTKKTVLLREMRIKHQEQAVMVAAPRAGDNQALLALYMQKELLKLLIIQINDQDVKPLQLEDMDANFTMAEYSQLLRVMRELMGEDAAMGKSHVEVVSSGAK